MKLVVLRAFEVVVMGEAPTVESISLLCWARPSRPTSPVAKPRHRLRAIIIVILFPLGYTSKKKQGWDGVYRQSIRPTTCNFIALEVGMADAEMTKGRLWDSGPGFLCDPTVAAPSTCKPPSFRARQQQRSAEQP